MTVFRRAFCYGAAALVFLIAARAEAADWRISVLFPEELRTEAYSGRVYLFLSKSKPEPRSAVDWFHPEPILALDVENLKPGERVKFESDELPRPLRFPADWTPDRIAGMNVQAMLRFNPWERDLIDGPGNGFSTSAKIPEMWDGTHAITLTVDKVNPPQEFGETETSRRFEVLSSHLKKHYGQEVAMSAAVSLPPSYATDAERRYPVMFIIPGFGGTHFSHRRYLPMYSADTQDVEFIRVLLDASCPEGHHVFADSANNGPRLTAFLTEFLPAFDAEFRTAPGREARFLTGHSSGGWSSLWMMLSAPESFAGVWSTAPDPVTFRDFSGIDLYADGANVYRDASSARRPLAHSGEQVLFYFEAFDQFETILGPGGQLRSFEAVFGGRGANGPEPAWSCKTGAVNRLAIAHWEQYDIVKRVEAEWSKKAPLCGDRIRVHMGDEDTFYLDGACRILQAALTERGEPQAVTMHPGKNHFTLLNRELMQQIHNEMAAHFRKHYTAAGAAR